LNSNAAPASFGWQVPVSVQWKGDFMVSHGHVKYGIRRKADMVALIRTREVLGETIDHETLVKDPPLVEVHFTSRVARDMAHGIREHFRATGGR
jgi:hypothetical protein